MDYLFSDSLEVLGMECEEGDSGKHTPCAYRLSRSARWRRKRL